MPNGEFLVFVTMPGTDEQWSGRFADPVVVGRDSDSEICLPHPLVSRRHAQFSLDDSGALLIRDLDSRNGTTVDGFVVRNDVVHVSKAAHVRIGPYAIVVNVETVPLELTLTMDAGDDLGLASKLRTILFTDIEESTRLTEQLGDEAARALIRDHEALVRDALASNGGTEHKTMGDGFMVSFTSASGALDAAIAMQRATARWFGAGDTPIRMRIGVNAGEPISEENDLHGASVIRAARVMAQARGGEIFATDLVRLLVDGKKYVFHDRGPADLKGFDEPVRLFEVHWRI